MEKINLEDYTYNLPNERIAQNPLEKRDTSKFLVYKKGAISHHHFTEITDFLNEDYTLYFNNTKVIPARLLFEKKATQRGQNGKGATIEIFLLHPILPTADVSEAMLTTGKCTWKCVVGNLKRWKEGLILERELEIDNQTILIQAKIADRKELLIELEWKNINSDKNNTEIPFVDIVGKLGVMPLPPYIKRNAEKKDAATYQTIYSKAAGAVAAPTAGLHFTETVLQNLAKKNIQTNELTLHVGAGTFQPVKKENAGDVVTHTMHCEQIVVTKENIKSIIDSKKVASVGTTSMRTLESLYWYGTKILLKQDTAFFVEKLEPYSYDAHSKLPSKKESFEAILKYMDDSNQDKLTGETEIFILPSYTFHVCDALVTNFHMPETTLILLVAAFIGNDWKKIYQTALDNDYRFLSYGDSSLLFL
ncbi:S-adenosylmethionine:tRNA-ribosyltransferase-isomerase (queuine synthetase) [Bernardetia litoralis DSM 6794]|uniref:S-adenosylmethionine:tRNA ribosyltransferase-isomerase n=1 Tax=Bernardetia litoralis (strain ATCC 23117 / DSM 6794 / NBRC 15988 / NCIMB 1366 / Fx l1 / Sio-4) TaxID=880071 RepID=I4AHY5_BERLS|nr:S-adenosylmethionine:tRNA ribosyltransferase-isomerase [Bernardetia litoralis]AFM03570.1 S-adenosylmethionine:tRNA-ribosyltransferase-isomerase (queuine synthetase) [Bernardetia litoralis DSM 6794]